MNGEIGIEVLTEKRAAEMIAFHKLCFPVDCWKDEDRDDLLHDPRAVYYALTEGGRIVGSVYIYNRQGEDVDFENPKENGYKYILEL